MAPGDAPGPGRQGRDGGAGRSARRRTAGVALALVVVAAAVAVAVSAARGSDGSSPDGSSPGGGDAGAEGGAGGGDRLDVAVVGDSLVEQSRDQFVAHAADAGLTVETFAFGGSAPCDWMDTFDELAAAPPRRLVISFAGNDSTPCINPGGGPPRDPETIADAYAEDMPGIVDLFAGTGTELYVVVPPPVGEPASEPAAAAIRAMYRDLVRARPEVTLVDPAPLLGPDGRFHRTLPCEPWEAAECGADGTIEVRHEDGIHLAPAGGERYARVLLAAIGEPTAD
ncbi:MAG TPA: GDSL-type esterase/lipase family protein [Acidimicrobiales bacterium]|nr:GDSL-type esterase/lipase family protein [Acidimicrobiales bacterium]